MTAMHRYRLGLGVIEAYLNERSAVVHWLRPSARRTEPVPVAPVRVVADTDLLADVAWLIAFVVLGVLIGWAT